MEILFQVKRGTKYRGLAIMSTKTGSFDSITAFKFHDAVSIAFNACAKYALGGSEADFFDRRFVPVTPGTD